MSKLHPSPETQAGLEDLVRQLTTAEEAVQASLGGEVDAVLLGNGHPYLLHKARQALEQSEAQQARLAAIVEASNDGIYSEALDGTVLTWNAAAETIYGYTAAEMINQNLTVLVPPEEHEEYHRTIRRIQQGEKIHHVEAMRLRKDGQKIWVSISIFPLKNDAGQIVGISNIARDITGHKQMQAALQASESRYHSLFENMVEGYCYCRLLYEEGRARDYIYLDVNSAFEPQTGLKDVPGKKVSEVVHGMHEANPEQLEIYSRVAETGRSERFETHAKQMGAWFSVSVYSHEKEHFIAVFDNITERKRMEARFNRLVDSNAQSVLFWNKKGEIVGGNDAFLNLVGYTREDLKAGRINWIAMTPPEYSHLDRNALEELEAHGASTPYEKEWIRKDGSRVPILLGAAAFEDNPDEGVCFAIGIAERKQAAETARLTSERMQLAAKAGGIGIWEFDCPSGLVTWDDQMFTLYGQSREEGRNEVAERWSNSLHPEDRARAEAELAASLHDDSTPFDTEFRIIRKDNGATRFIRAIATLLHDASGKPWRMVGTNWDITDEHKREQDLAEALEQQRELTRAAQAGVRAKSEFLAVMSHEIRTPLHGILGYSELLGRTPNLPPESSVPLQTITSSGKALLRILDDLLDFSRLEAGCLQIEKDHFTPWEIFRDIRALLAQKADEKGLDLEISVDGTIPRNLEGDAGRLRQILLNLAGNAIKFTEHGSVTLGLRSGLEATKYEFFVKDTGPGIVPAQLEDIFLPFTQADSSISRRHGGTGLGLSISRRLAELMGGNLEARSQLGHGSEFVVTVPLNEAEPSLNSESVIPAQTLDESFARQHPLRILVVEDDKVNLKLILSLLSRLGYEAQGATNGREAVEVYQRELPDCVLMDLQMPEMDGIEATEKIRSYEKTKGDGFQTFISALTANIFPADRQRCFDVGMNGYLNKPVQMAGLAGALVEAGKFASKHS